MEDFNTPILANISVKARDNVMVLLWCNDNTMQKHVKASDGNSDKDNCSADGSSQNFEIFWCLVHVPPIKDATFIL